MYLTTTWIYAYVRTSSSCREFDRKPSGAATQINNHFALYMPFEDFLEWIAYSLHVTRYDYVVDRRDYIIIPRFVHNVFDYSIMPAINKNYMARTGLYSCAFCASHIDYYNPFAQGTSGWFCSRASGEKSWKVYSYPRWLALLSGSLSSRVD